MTSPARPGCKPGLVIFDCDGVLVDSEPLANRVFCKHLQEAGFALAEDAGRKAFTGLSLGSCLALVEQRFGRPLPPDFLEALQRATYAAFEQSLRPVPGVEEAIARIDLPRCVASSGSLEKMRLTLGLTGLLPWFGDRLFSATQVARGKPAPDLFLHAARQMQVAPAACVVIEDSRPGVEAARAAGMRVLGYAGGYPADAPDLAAAGAEVFMHMQDLPKLFALP